VKQKHFIQTDGRCAAIKVEEMALIAATMLVFSTDLLEIAAFNGLVVQNVSDRTICAIF
jgi:hypothetical protein